MLFEENWQDHHSKLVSNWMVAEFLLPPKSVCRSKFIEGCLKSGGKKMHELKCQSVLSSFHSVSTGSED